MAANNYSDASQFEYQNMGSHQGFETVNRAVSMQQLQMEKKQLEKDIQMYYQTSSPGSSSSGGSNGGGSVGKMAPHSPDSSSNGGSSSLEGSGWRSGMEFFSFSSADLKPTEIKSKRKRKFVSQHEKDQAYWERVCTLKFLDIFDNSNRWTSDSISTSLTTELHGLKQKFLMVYLDSRMIKVNGKEVFSPFLMGIYLIFQ